MADETPPAPSENPDDATKNETIRITLPPKSEQPAVKRETVRINVPGKPITPIGAAPKKETTKLPMVSSSEGSTPPPPPPPPAGGKPFVPPPPSPKPPPSAPGVPPPSVKPLGGAASPPRPPTIGARPTVPLKPAPGGGPGAPEPITQKAAAPKKETARITLPPEGSKTPLPKATVKMQQTQPLASRPQSGVVTAPVTTGVPVMAAGDTAINGMAIAALILSLVALATAYLAYSAAGAP